MDANDVPKLPPFGYAAVANPSIALQAAALEILKKNQDLGTLNYFKLEGTSYVGRIEPHPPAPSRGLTDWHKGVTLYMADHTAQINNVKAQVKDPKFLGVTGGAIAGTYLIPIPIVGTVIGGALGLLGGTFFKK